MENFRNPTNVNSNETDNLSSLEEFSENSFLKAQDAFRVNIPENLIDDEIKKSLKKALSSANMRRVEELISNFNISPDVLDSEEMKTEAKKAYLKHIELGWFESSDFIKKRFNLDEEMFSPETIQRTSQEGLLNFLLLGSTWNSLGRDGIELVIDRIQKQYEFSEDIIIFSIEKMILKDLSLGNFTEIESKFLLFTDEKYKEIFLGMSKFPDFNKKIITGFFEMVESKKTEEFFEFCNKFQLMIDVDFSKIEKRLLETILNDQLKDDFYNLDIKSLEKIKIIFNLADDAYDKFMEKILIKYLEYRSLKSHSFNESDLNNIKEKFNLSDDKILELLAGVVNKLLLSGEVSHVLRIIEKMTTEDVQTEHLSVQEHKPEKITSLIDKKSVNIAMRRKLSTSPHSQDLVSLANTFDISLEEFMLESENRDFVIKRILFFLNQKHYFNRNNIPDEIIFSEEIQKGLSQYIHANINNDDFDIFKLLKYSDSLVLKESAMESSEIKIGIKNKILRILENGESSTFFALNEKIDISEFFSDEKELQENLGQFVKMLIDNNDLYSVIRVCRDGFIVPVEFMQSPEVQKAAQKQMLRLLSHDDFMGASQLKKIFKINLEDLYSLLPNDAKNKVEMLEQVLPGFQQKMFSSLEILGSILQLSFEDVQTLINNPNLLKSFEENPSMGVKLLIQYPKFSESPKENIDTILEIKRKIMEHHPNIDPNSPEFRILMQEQLKLYRRNLDMLTQMKEEGVNIDQWLNYSEEALFELGGEEASYTELIKLPSERIQRTLQKYEEEIRTALSKYKKELLDKQVSLIDISEIEQKITQMEQLAQEAKDAGNEGKAQGIQKGIEGLKKQVENPKKIPAWLKIMSDVDTVSKLFAKVRETNTQIATLDTELTTLTQNPSKESQKKMFENKQKIKELSSEFVSLLGTTSTRMDSLLLSIQNSLSQTLGKDISEELISKLNTDLAEDHEHFHSDKTTLENILKMNESEDDVKGSLLKIKVWDRNPDIDLYQGNYSDCCVRIDSDFHDSDSPISDYVTDLGIQIVAVYDEKTKKPFATAWCFVGEDEQGNKAFVIDNIEAVGPYLKYKDNIQEKVKSYIEKYAEASGLETISQGPHNNDLIVTDNLEKKYTKLGGYNVTDGYYLEAEPDDEEDENSYYVNEDLEQEEFERLERVEEQRLINEYSRTQENIVSLEEALNRAQNG